MNVVLTTEDYLFAKEIACKRNNTQREGKRNDGKVLPDSLGIDIQGALAEYAFSKAAGFDWDGRLFNLEEWELWRKFGHDVNGIEIRSTKHKNGCLIVHPKDKDNAPFVLVVCDSNTSFSIKGWAFGYEAKDSKYWKDVGYGRPCYYYPQKNLKPIEDLLRRMV